MTVSIERFTPSDVMAPVGPYSHIAKYGDFIVISGTAGVDPRSNEIAGADIETQTAQILDSFHSMLAKVNSDFEHVLHISVFLKDMKDFSAMNKVYADKMGDCRPARTAIGVTELPKPGAKVTMNLTAVTADSDKRFNGAPI